MTLVQESTYKVRWIHCFETHLYSDKENVEKNRQIHSLKSGYLEKIVLKIDFGNRVILFIKDALN